MGVGPTVGAAQLDIVPTIDKGWRRRLDSDVSTAAGGVTSKFKGAFGGIGKMAAGVGAAFAVKKGFDFLGDAVSAGRESLKISKLTEQVIKTTGGAANVSAAGVGAYADKLAGLTGIDDEIIASGENMLLTFTNVRNEVGKGNDVFNQATSIANDMSVALGQDMKSSAMQLGKALNDPIKGVSALQRVGVSFTADQKKQIKGLVEHGKTLEAQKVILSELGKEFGGAAAAAATPMDRLKVTLGNVQEKIGMKLIPVLDKGAAWLGDKLPGAIAVTEKWLGKASDTVKAFWYTFTTGFTQDEGTPIERFALQVRDAWASAQPFVEWLKANWKPVMIGVAAAFLLITSPVSAVIAALTIAYVKFSWFRTGVNAVIAFLTGVVFPAIATFARGVSEQFSHLAAWVKGHMASFQEAIGHVIAVVQAIWRMFGDNVMTIVKSKFETVKAIVKAAVDIVRGIIETVTHLINGDWGKAWDSFKGIFKGAWNAVFAIVKDAVKTVVTILSGLGETIGRIAPKLFDGLKSAFKAVINWVIDRWNGLEFKIPGFHKSVFGKQVGFDGFTLGVPDIPKLHGGGVYRAPTFGGEGLALLRDRERVITPEEDARSGGRTGNTYQLSVTTMRSDADLTEQFRRMELLAG